MDFEPESHGATAFLHLALAVACHRLPPLPCLIEKRTYS